MVSRLLNIGTALCFLVLSASPALADCIRSCTAYLLVELTYQPKGDEHVQRKTPMLKTTKSETREGRFGGGCIPSGIIKAKERACTDAVQSLMNEFRSFRAQKEAVCQSVQLDSTLDRREKAGFPEADWYLIDKIKVFGERDIVKRSGFINTDKKRFTCQEGNVINPSAQQPSPTPAPPPTPSIGTSMRNAPPPSPSLPQPPGGKPDLIITHAELIPTGECRENRPVLSAKVTVRNIGRAPAPEITTYAMVNAIDTRINWGNGKIMGAIPPGSSVTVEFPIAYLKSNPGYMAGNHLFRFTVDPGNKILESNEENNTVENPVAVPCRP